MVDDCRFVDVDGEAIRVRGAREMSDDDRAAFADVIRAAKAHAATLPAVIRRMRPSPETSRRYWEMWCGSCGIEEGMADRRDEPRLVERLAQHNAEFHPTQDEREETDR